MPFTSEDFKAVEMNAQYFSEGVMEELRSLNSEDMSGMTANGYYRARVYAQLLFLEENPEAGIADLMDPGKFIEEKQKAGKQVSEALAAAAASDRSLFDNITSRIQSNLKNINVMDEDQRSIANELAREYFAQNRDSILAATMDAHAFIPEDIPIAKDEGRGAFGDFGRSAASNNTHIMMFMMSEGKTLRQVMSSTTEERNDAAKRFKQMLDEHRNDPEDARASFYGGIYQKMGEAIMQQPVPDIDWSNPLSILSVAGEMHALRGLAIGWRQSMRALYNNPEFYDYFDIDTLARQDDALMGVGILADSASRFFSQKDINDVDFATARYTCENVGPQMAGRTLNEISRTMPERGSYLNQLSPLLTDIALRYENGLNEKELYDYVNYRGGFINFQPAVDQAEAVWQNRGTKFPEEFRERAAARHEWTRRKSQALRVQTVDGQPENAEQMRSRIEKEADQNLSRRNAEFINHVSPLLKNSSILARLPIGENSFSQIHDKKQRLAVERTLQENGRTGVRIPALGNYMDRKEEMDCLEAIDRYAVLTTAVPAEFRDTYQALHSYLVSGSESVQQMKEWREIINEYPAIRQGSVNTRPGSGWEDVGNRLDQEIERNAQVRESVLWLMGQMWGEDQEGIQNPQADPERMERLRHYLDLDGISLDRVFQMVNQTRQADRSPADLISEISMNIQVGDIEIAQPYLADMWTGSAMLSDGQKRFAEGNFDRVFAQIFPASVRENMAENGKNLFDNIYVNGQSMNDMLEERYAYLPYSLAQENMKCELMRYMLQGARVDVSVPGKEGDRLVHLRAFSGYHDLNDALFAPRLRDTRIPDEIQAAVRASKEAIDNRLSAPGVMEERRARMIFERSESLTTENLPRFYSREETPVTDLDLPTYGQALNQYNLVAHGNLLASMHTDVKDQGRRAREAGRYSKATRSDKIVESGRMFDDAVRQLSEKGQLMNRETMEIMGVENPVQLFYVDGRPAWDYLTEYFDANQEFRGQKPDMNNPLHIQILKGEIMAAMVSGLYPVEVVSADRDPVTGEIKTHASQMRLDLSVFVGKEKGTIPEEIVIDRQSKTTLISLQNDLFANDTAEARAARQSVICSHFEREHVPSGPDMREAGISLGNAKQTLELSDLGSVPGRLLGDGSRTPEISQRLQDGVRLFTTMNKKLGIHPEESADMLDTGILASPAEMYYIDGVPAWEYIHAMPEYAAVDKTSPDFERILKTEIVAAAASGMHHVDVARVGMDEKGAYQTAVMDVKLNLTQIPALDEQARKLQSEDKNRNERKQTIRDDINAKFARAVTRKLEDSRNPYKNASDRFNINRSGTFKDYFGYNSPKSMPAPARMKMRGFSQDILQHGILSLTQLYMMSENPQIRLADLMDPAKYKTEKQAAGNTMQQALEAINGSPADSSMLYDVMEGVIRQIANMDLKQEIAYAIGVDLDRKPPYSQREFYEQMEKPENSPKVSAVFATVAGMAEQVERMELQVHNEIRDRLDQQTMDSYARSLSALKSLKVEQLWMDANNRYRSAESEEPVDAMAAHVMTEQVREFVAADGLLANTPDDLVRSLTDGNQLDRVKDKLEAMRADGIPGIQMDALHNEPLRRDLKEAMPGYKPRFTGITERDFYENLKYIPDSQSKQVIMNQSSMDAQSATRDKQTYFLMYKKGTGFLKGPGIDQNELIARGDDAFRKLVDELHLDHDNDDILKYMDAGPDRMESMFYIDGIPAVEYAKQIYPDAGMDQWDRNPEARSRLRTVIASAAWSTEHHLDMVQVGADQRGNMKVGTMEVRPDLEVLDGMERWYETKPSKAADKFYSKAGTEERHQQINRDYRQKFAPKAMNAMEKWKMDIQRARYNNRVEGLGGQYFDASSMEHIQSRGNAEIPGIAEDELHGALVHAQILFLAQNPEAGLADLTDPASFTAEKAKAGKMFAEALANPAGSPPEHPSLNDIMDTINNKLTSINLQDELQKISTNDALGKEGNQGGLKYLAGDLAKTYYKIHEQKILEPSKGEKQFFPQGFISLVNRPDFHDFGRSTGANNAHAMMYMMMEGRSLQDIISNSTQEEREAAAKKILDIMEEHKDEPEEKKAAFYGDIFKKMGDAIMNFTFPDIDWSDPIQLLSVKPLMSAYRDICVSYIQGSEPLYRNPAFYDHYDLDSFNRTAKYVAEVGVFPLAVTGVFNESLPRGEEAANRHILETYGPKLRGRTLGEAFDAEWKDKELEIGSVRIVLLDKADDPTYELQLDDYLNFRTSTPFEQQKLLSDMESWPKTKDRWPKGMPERVAERQEMLRQQAAQKAPQQMEAKEEPVGQKEHGELPPQGRDVKEAKNEKRIMKKFTTLMAEEDAMKSKSATTGNRQRSNSISPTRSAKEAAPIDKEAKKGQLFHN